DAIGQPRARPILARRGELVRTRRPYPDRFDAEPITLGATYHTGKSYELTHVLGKTYEHPLQTVDEVDADLDALLDYYVALKEDALIVSTFNSSPGDDEGDP